MDLTTDLVDEICQKIADGNFPETAAVASGVTSTQFSNWTKRGNTEMVRLDEGQKLNKDDAIYVHLIAQIDLAQATSESRAVSFWQNHVSENWQAAKEFLSRRFPSRWSSNPTPQN